MSYSFGILKVQRGKDKKTMDTWIISEEYTKNQIYCPKTTSSPFQLLREHLAKGNLLAWLKKKTTQEVLKLSKDVLTRDHVLHYSKDSNNIQSRLQLPFNYAFLTQLKKQITHCDLYQPYMF